jgi:hypothetical protein
MGAGYLLARMARGGDEAALDLLVAALRAADDEDVKPIGQNWGDGPRRAAMYGLSMVGEAAVRPLMEVRLAILNFPSTIWPFIEDDGTNVIQSAPL